MSSASVGAPAGKKHYYGFVIVIVMMLLMIPACLITSVASIFYVPVSQGLGFSVADYGVTQSIVQFTTAFCAPTIFSKLCRKYNIRYVLISCLAVETIAWIIRSMATSIWTLYFTSVLLAFPMSIMFAFSIPILMNQWFPTKTGTMMGIISACQGLGGVIFSTLGSIIIVNYGWRTCFASFAVISLIGIPLAYLFIRAKPEDVGQTPYGLDEGNGKGVKAEALKPKGIDAGQAVHSKLFYMILMSLPVSNFVACMAFFFNAYSQSVGLTIVAAGVVASMFQLGTMFFKLTLGAVCDKSMHLGVIYFCGCAIIALLLFVTGSSRSILMTGAFLYGGISASVNLFGPLLVKYVFGTKDFTTIWGRVTGFSTLLGGIGSFLWGYAMQAISYRTCFLIGLAIVIYIMVIYLSVVKGSGKVRKAWTE